MGASFSFEFILLGTNQMPAETLDFRCSVSDFPAFILRGRVDV